jgi:hypothetical protein
MRTEHEKLWQIKEKFMNVDRSRKNETFDFVATSEQLHFIEYLISNFIDEQYEGLGDEIKKLTEIDNSNNEPNVTELYFIGDNLKKLSMGILCMDKIKFTLEHMKNEE